MPTIKKTRRESRNGDELFSVRFRPPSQFDRIRTPPWAQTVAQSVSSGAVVTMGRTPAGNWLVQNVDIEAGFGKDRNDAQRLARQIVRKVED